MRVEWYLIHKPMNTIWSGPFYTWDNAVKAQFNVRPSEDFIIVGRMVPEKEEI